MLESSRTPVRRRRCRRGAAQAGVVGGFAKFGAGVAFRMSDGLKPISSRCGVLPAANARGARSAALDLRCRM